MLISPPSPWSAVPGMDMFWKHTLAASNLDVFPRGPMESPKSGIYLTQ